MTSNTLDPLPSGTRLVHVAAWASDAAALTSAISAYAGDLSRVSLHHAGRAAMLADVHAEGETHVHVALRSPEQSLARSWYEHVESGGRPSYDDWVAAMMDPAGASPTAGLLDPRPFLEELITAYGSSNVSVSATVAGLSPTAPVEQLVGLPDGSLADGPTPSRPLTAGETEMIRVVNAAFADQHWPESERERYVAAITVALRRQDPAGDDSTPALPDHARTRLLEVHTGTLALIARSGVGTYGELSTPVQAPTADAVSPQLRPASAARAVAAAIVTSGVTEQPVRDVALLARLEEASVRQVVGEIGARLRRRRRSTAR